MKKTFFFLFVLFSISSISAQPYYVAGDFQGWSNNTNMMYDDATHGDIVSGDGIYSLEFSVATSGFHGWKVTNGTWDTTWPSADSWFYSTTDPQTVLFTFDTNPKGDSWLPNQAIVNTNEVKPTALVAVGNFQSEEGESGDWINNSTITAMHDDGLDGDWLSGDGIFCYHMTSLPTGSYSAKGVKTGEWNGWGTDGRSQDAKNIDFITTSNNQNVYLYVDVNSGRTIITLDNPLPVELVSFTAKAMDLVVLLEWETATEVNNYGFDVEASNDNVNWNVIGFVEGNGNSNSPKSYSFVATDNSKYYRLKQVDTDGGFEYSGVVEVAAELSYKLAQNHPNPFNPTTKINFSIPEVAKVSITVFNALGQEVAELANREFAVGNHSIEFNASNLNSGIYFYRLQSSNYSKTMKMLLIK